ncbi:4-hydroxy-tetrahydrodipicolinate reductase [soil metagenome]
MASPIRIALSGARGRMGQAVARLIAEDPGLALSGGIERVPEESGWAAAGGVVLRPPDDAAAIVRDADVVVDFSSPECVRGLLRLPPDCWRTTALVVGTTGLEQPDRDALESLAGTTAVLQAANFSAGFNVLLALTGRAAAALGPEYDVEIVETHHRRKRDAPSGSALVLADKVAAARGRPLDEVATHGRSGQTGERSDREIGIHALRGGGVVGEHRVLFLGERERVELAHSAAEREVFAAGALRAARWIVGRPPGRYTFAQVLGLEG